MKWGENVDVFFFILMRSHGWDGGLLRTDGATFLLRILSSGHPFTSPKTRCEKNNGTVRAIKKFSYQQKKCFRDEFIEWNTVHLFVLFSKQVSAVFSSTNISLSLPSRDAIEIIFGFCCEFLGWGKFSIRNIWNGTRVSCKRSARAGCNGRYMSEIENTCSGRYWSCSAICNAQLDEYRWKSHCEAARDHSE